MSTFSMPARYPRALLLGLLLALLATALVYKPGLSGIFIFDDYSNIFENSRLREAPPTWEGMKRAAFSMDIGFLRPVSMLSLWANVRISELDSFGFKLTNL